MSKQTYFSRYNKWLVPLLGDDYDTRVLYYMFNYFGLDPQKNTKEIYKMLNGILEWKNRKLSIDSITYYYPIFEEEVEKDDIIRKGVSESIDNKKIIISESQFNKLFLK